MASLVVGHQISMWPMQRIRDSKQPFHNKDGRRLSISAHRIKNNLPASRERGSSLEDKKGPATSGFNPVLKARSVPVQEKDMQETCWRYAQVGHTLTQSPIIKDEEERVKIVG